MKKVSNEAGKQALSKSENNKVIFDKHLPHDVNKWHLLLIAIFLGLFGVQYKVVGRKKMFLYMLISFCLIFLYSILLAVGLLTIDMFYDKYLSILCWAMIFPESVALIVWFMSIVQILTNTFKVPVAIDENLVVNSYNDSVASKLIQEVKDERKNFENVKSKKIKLKKRKIKVVCKSCGETVTVSEDEVICPKCDESLKG